MDNTGRQGRSCVMKRKYYYRKLVEVALITMPRMNNVFVCEKKEVFEYYIVVMKILYF